MSSKNINFLNFLSLRGPNIWTYRPIVEAWVDIGELEDFPSNKIPGLYERLTAWLPGLIEHRCGVGERGGFLLRLREGTWAGHILEHVTIELQNLAGMQSGFGKARETSTRGVYKVVVRSRHEQVTMAAFQAARELLMAAIEDRPHDVAATVAPLRDMVDSLCLGPSTGCIVDAATERGIPHIRLNEGNLVQLGYGVQQRRIWTAETDQTSAIAESICSDKDLTKRLLASCGIPVPEGELVSNLAQAWEAAEDIGTPVVVKPSDANHGRGVSINLTTREEIEAAYQLAADEGSDVIVERFIPGKEHRLLVVGGRVAAAACGETATITGDGQATIAELIDRQLNSDPRRGITEDCPLNRIILEEDHTIRLELSRQGYSADSVPPAGKVVLVQPNGNMAFDVTEQVHPSIEQTVALAARIVGLDIAGVDLVAEDISRPLEEQQGAIVEINAGPGLLMHLKPASGEPRPVGKHIVESLFPGDANGRIPIVGISGSTGTATVARLLSGLVHLSGKQVGMASSEGLFFNHRRVEAGDKANWASARKVLINRATEIAVFENSARNILTEGLAYDRCNIGIITDVQDAADLQDFYIHDQEQRFNVLRTQVDVVLPEGTAILNASDPLAIRMAELCDGEVMYFDTDSQNPILLDHLAQNKRAVLVREEHIVLAHGQHKITLHPLIGSIPPATLLAASAAAWALNLPAELIRAGLDTFQSQPQAEVS
jgi:cyanophycin synthetase